MQIGVCLLSKDGYYLREDGSLPIRPSWDKEFLTSLVKNLYCVASKNTIDTLPKSIIDNAAGIFNDSSYLQRVAGDINLGIKTFRDLPELLFITRSNYSVEGGKLLRLDNYTKIIDFTKSDGGFEIWKLNNMKH